jgi:hypothetical protein
VSDGEVIGRIAYGRRRSRRWSKRLCIRRLWKSSLMPMLNSNLTHNSSSNLSLSCFKHTKSSFFFPVLSIKTILYHKIGSLVPCWRENEVFGFVVSGNPAAARPQKAHNIPPKQIIQRSTTLPSSSCSALCNPTFQQHQTPSHAIHPFSKQSSQLYDS